MNMYVCRTELPTLIPALLWTRKDIREFKESLRKKSDNILRISSLSMATVSLTAQLYTVTDTPVHVLVYMCNQWFSRM